MVVPEGYKTIEQIAESLKCSTSTVYRLIRNDDLTARLRKGHERGMVVKDTDLERWVMEQFGVMNDEE